MKKTLLTLLFVSGIYMNLNAQSTKKNSKINDQKNIELVSEIIIKDIGEIDDKLYTLCLKGRSDYFLKVIDINQKKLLLTIPIVVSQKNGEEVEFEDIVIIQNKLYVLENVFSEKTKINALVGVELSKESPFTKIIGFNTKK